MNNVNKSRRGEKISIVSLGFWSLIFFSFFLSPAPIFINFHTPSVLFPILTMTTYKHCYFFPPYGVEYYLECRLY